MSLQIAPNRRALLGYGAAGLTLSLSSKSAIANTVSLTGPLPDTPTKGLQVWDPRGQGYDALEYFLTGQADVYEPVSMADATDTGSRDNVADQARHARYERQTTARDQPYTTRLVIYRPRDPARFSGNVVVESFHPARGGDSLLWRAINAFYMRRGDAYVGVQHPTTYPGLHAADPTRYGALNASHSSQLWGMLSDVGRRLKGGGIDGLKGRRIYLTGYSFTGVATSTFANYHHHLTRLADGAPVYDGYASFAGGMFARTLDVPIIRMNNQSDFNVMGAFANRNEAGDAPGRRIRHYELTGASHVIAPIPEAGSALPPRDVKVAEGKGLPNFSPSACFAKFPAGYQPNTFPTRLMQEAIFSNLYAWVDHGAPPPRADFIATDDAGQARLDPFGNALGGVRLPPIEVPVATYGMGFGLDCFLYGYTLPFSRERKAALYGDRSGYVAKVAASAKASAEARWILPEGRDELIAWAQGLEGFST